MRSWTKRLALLFLALMGALGLLALVWSAAQSSSQAQQEDAMQNCPLSGRWAISVWSGQDGTDAEQALSTCGEEAVAVAYSIDPDTQSWLRYFVGRPEISSLMTLDDMQGVMTLGGAGASASAAAGTPAQENAVQDCPPPGKWAISVWSGHDGAGIDAALASCGPGAVGVAYQLDPYTGGWRRWFEGQPTISNLATLNNLQGIIALGSGSFTLGVDKFGDGTITSSPEGIDCDSECTYQSATFLAGSSAVLTAVADSGSTLAYWTGCDSVAGNSCTVEVDRDRTVFPTFAFSEVKIPETTIVLDEATMDYLLRQEGSTYYFDSQAQAVANLEAGDVIVSDATGGLFRKVVAVSVTGQEIAVETADASLEDTIEQGTIILRTSLTRDDLQSADADTLEEECCTDSAVGWCMDTDFAGVQIGGETCFDVDLDIAVSFAGWDWDCWCYPVKEVRTIATVAHNMDLGVSTGKDFEVSDEKEIAHYNFTPIWVTIGILPVGFFPELSVNVGVDGSAEAKISSEINLSNELKVGVHYRRGSGWAPVADYQRSFEWEEPEASLGAEAKAYVAPRLSVKVYGLVGPYFDLQGYLRLSVQPMETPWWSLYGGINASAGLDMDALGLSLEDYSMSLGEKEWLLAQAAESQDSDGDGIADADDTCPAEAEDHDGFEDDDGCPDTDNDQDGILDNVDACPNEAENVNGYQDEDGCPDEIPTVDVSGVVYYGNGLAYDGGPGLYVSAHLCRKDSEDPTEIEDWTTGECQEAGVATTKLTVGQFVLPDVSSGDYTIFITCERCDPREEWAKQDISVKDPPEPVSVAITLPTTSTDWPAFVGTLFQISPVAGFWLVETTSPLLGTIPVVVSLGWPSGPFWCDGTIDPDAAEGDSVEVYATLYEIGNHGWFNTCRSAAYYAGSPACTIQRNEWEFFLEGTGYVWGGSGNPATIYCTELGYEWSVETGELGDYGVCTFPDDTVCEEWDFWRGECGQDWTYCEQQGGQVITVDSAPEHPCTPGTDDPCAYCVLKC
jgi:putative hemolysin